MQSERNNNAMLANQTLTQQQEDERERRMLEKEEATARRINAHEVAMMVKPATDAHTEEAERQRRLGNRDECVARKAAAQEASNLIRDELDNPHPSNKSEEVERQRRLQDRDESVARKIAAQQASNLIREDLDNSPSSNKSEEAERQRRLQDRDESVARKIAAQEVSNLIREDLDKPLTFPMLTQMEEQERQRRLDDHNEAITRKNHGHEASDAIRTESATIKARFVKRPSLWKKISPYPSAVGRVIYNNLPAPATIGNAVYNNLPAPATIGNAVYNNLPAPATIGNAYDTAKTVTGGIASTAASYLPSFASLMHTAHTIKDTVMHHIPFVEHPATLADVKAAEELERQRRIAEDRSSSALGNARRVSQLVRYAHGRYIHKAYPSGFHRYTTNWEERERTRRLANKGEMENRRMMACRVSNIVNQLGWPFIRSAKGKLPFTPSAALAEEERNRILGDETGMITARFGAKKMAGLIKDAFAPIDHSAMSRFTRNLEEKERRHRMRHPEESVHLAHKLADIIKNIGAPFYVPSCTIADQIGELDYNNDITRPKFDTLYMRNAKLQARRAAMRISKAQALKKSSKDIKLSQEVTREMPKNIDTRCMEEDERKARLGDKALSQLAIDNARKVSGMINKQKGSYKERQVSFKPDVEIIPAQPSNISPASLQLYPMQRSLAPVQPSTISPPSTQVAPMHHTIAPVQPSTISPPSTQVAPMHHIIAPVQPSVISPPSTQVAPMPHIVAPPPVQPAQFSQPVQLPAQRAVKVHTATALPGSPYPERVQATPLYEAPFSKISPLPTHNLMQAPQPVTMQSPALVAPGPVFMQNPQPAIIQSPALVASGPVSQFVFPEQQHQQHIAPATPIHPPTPVQSVTFVQPATTIQPQHIAPAMPIQSVTPVHPATTIHHQHVGPATPVHSVTFAPTYAFPPPQQQPILPVSNPNYASVTIDYKRSPAKPVLNPVTSNLPLSTPSHVSTYAPTNAPRTTSFTQHAAPVYTSVHTSAPAPVMRSVSSSVPHQAAPVTTYAPAPAAHSRIRQAAPNPGAQQKLVESVQKLYDAENSLAEKERQKMLSYQQKESGWSKFRAQRHAAAAARHSENAKRHQEWLGMVNPGQPAL